MENLSLDGSDYIPLCDLLKRTGMCSNGGHAKGVISEGEVKVDGEIDLKKRSKITVNQVVEFNGQSVRVIK